MFYRKTREEDFPLIGDALLEWLLLSPNYGYVHKTNLSKTVGHIYNKHLEGDTYIVDDNYLLIVESITPWFGDDRLLQEQLVLRLTSNGNIKNIPKVLEQIAIDRKDTAVLLSDSSIELRLSPIYERCGYTKVTNSFYKEIKHG